MPNVGTRSSLLSAPFQKYDDIFGHRDTKTQRRNTERPTRRRAAAVEACQPQTNDHWTVARSFVCGLRASRLGLLCRPTASSASVSQCLCGLSKSIRRRKCEMLYLAAVGPPLRRVRCDLAHVPLDDSARPADLTRGV